MQRIPLELAPGWLLRCGILLALVAAGAGCQTARTPPAADLQASESPDPEAVRLVEQFRASYPERRAAAQSLIDRGESAVPALIAASRDPDPMVRWEAVNTLGYIRSPRSIPAVLERVLEDPDVHARWRSIWSLNSINDGTVPGLLRPHLSAPDPRRRWNAAVALSVLGGQDAIPILHEGLKHPDPFTRWEAANGLGATHDSRTPRLLADALDDSPTDVRQEIALSLGRIGGPAALPGLARALNDPASEVRWRAAMALGRLQSPDARALLEARQQIESDAMVRENLEASLKRLSAA